MKMRVVLLLLVVCTSTISEAKTEESSSFPDKLKKHPGWVAAQIDLPDQKQTVPCTNIFCQLRYGRNASINADARYLYGASGGAIYPKAGGLLLGGDLTFSEGGYSVSSRAGFALSIWGNKIGIAPYGKVGYAKVSTNCQDATPGYCDLDEEIRDILPADFDTQTIEKGGNYGGGVLLRIDWFVVDVSYSTRTKLSIGVGAGFW